MCERDKYWHFFPVKHNTKTHFSSDSSFGKIFWSCCSSGSSWIFSIHLFWFEIQWILENNSNMIHRRKKKNHLMWHIHTKVFRKYSFGRKRSISEKQSRQTNKQQYTHTSYNQWKRPLTFRTSIQYTIWCMGKQVNKWPLNPDCMRKIHFKITDFCL